MEDVPVEGNSAAAQILHLQFNQDCSCFSIGTTNGFVIFNSDPLKERFRRNFGRGLGHVEMLFKCNILALIGGGSEPLYPRNKVMLWDDYKAKCFAELEFRSEVLNVRLRRDKVVVVLQKMVYIYNFSDLSLLSKHDTHLNPQGLCALSSDHQNTVLACPAVKPGHVRVDLFDIGKTHVIAAHSGELTQLVLNLEGTLLATASDKGTLIRIWDTVTGLKVREFRRGTKTATIYSIAFSRNSNYIIVGSDKGTVHLYALYENNNNKGGPADASGGAPLPPSGANSNSMSASGGAAEDTTDDSSADSVKNKHSRLSFMKDVLPGYFSSEWSFASFTVEVKDPSKRFYTAFGAEETTILVVCEDGTYFKYMLKPEQAKIIQIGDASFR